MKNNKPREVYYDIQINNFESSGTTSQPLRFSETRNMPLIKNSGEYSLSIVRFELDTYSLPSFIADIMPYPNTDANKMIETVTLDWNKTGDVTTEQSLEWIPTNQHIATPRAPAPLQDASTEYYYGNSFRHYCDIVNNALETATNELKTTVGFLLNDLLPPKLIWNDQAQMAELIAQKEFYNWDAIYYVGIHFNRALYGKLTSFPALKNYNATDGRIYKLYMYTDYSTKLIDLDINGDSVMVPFIKTSQEYSTIANWSAVSSIVFTTNTLPIVSTQMSEPLVYNDGKSISTSIPQNFAQVISDMATNDLCYKPNLIYVPSAEYRMIDMFGNNDITTVDINVFWKDKKGNMVPFYLQSGASASIKVLFRLK